MVLAVDDLHAGHPVLHEVDQHVDGTAAHHVHAPRRWDRICGTTSLAPHCLRSREREAARGRGAMAGAGDRLR
jgi:hypothetical protein